MISVFDMFSIGIGPSSSHTVGPMRAAFDFAQSLEDKLKEVTHIHTELYGSLGQTGIGHGTGKAIILGLSGYQPEQIEVEMVKRILEDVAATQHLSLMQQHRIAFPSSGAMIFHRRKTLPRHSNAMTIDAYNKERLIKSETYYSIGGGFIINDKDFVDSASDHIARQTTRPVYPFDTAEQLIAQCQANGLTISSLMLANEAQIRTKEQVKQQCAHLWQVMRSCIEQGIQNEGILPGGLKVTRRAPALYRRLKTEKTADPMAAMDWVNLYALAVNEENAAGGRVVTAPTNGAAGIIPAVLSYYDKFIEPVTDDIAMRFLLTAAAIGILYKKNASISGAEVGCQGEVGVACSMAAGALTEILGGTVQAVENAAEIGMEHNLGLTCDPVGGLVQVPCIERNAMGAIKAINASRLALRGNGQHKVSLDKVIKTMRETGRDMKNKYKETARGGLAVNIIEC